MLGVHEHTNVVAKQWIRSWNVPLSVVTSDSWLCLLKRSCRTATIRRQWDTAIKPASDNDCGRAWLNSAVEKNVTSAVHKYAKPHQCSVARAAICMKPRRRVPKMTSAVFTARIKFYGRLSTLPINTPASNTARLHTRQNAQIPSYLLCRCLIFVVK